MVLGVHLTFLGREDKAAINAANSAVAGNDSGQAATAGNDSGQAATAGNNSGQAATAVIKAVITTCLIKAC